MDSLPSAKYENTDEEGTRHAMVNVIEPHFNLHSEGVNLNPLKELKFNSHNITAAMTSRQFQVMLDVLNNFLLARLPKPPKSSLTLPNEDDENVEEEADEVVPDGIEEVELAKINLEKKEREQELLLNDMKKLSFLCDPSKDPHPEKEPACG